MITDLNRMQMGQLLGPILIPVFNGLDQLMVLAGKFAGQGVAKGAKVEPQHASTIIKQAGIEQRKVRIVSGFADGDMKIAVGFDHCQYVAIGNGFLELGLLILDVLQVLIGSQLSRQTRRRALYSIQRIDKLGKFGNVQRRNQGAFVG